MTAIEDKYNALLAAGLSLGNPEGAEEPTFDGGALGRYEHGVIYFHPRLGTAFEVHGAILGEYVARFETMSELGYPLSDELDDPDVPGGRLSWFEFGRIAWASDTWLTVTIDPPLTFAPQVVVKVHDSIPVAVPFASSIGAQEFAALAGPEGALVGSALTSVLPDLELHRLWGDADPDAITALVTQAVDEDPTYEPPRFENFLEIDCPAGFDPSALVVLLEGFSPVVEYAYVVEDPSDPVTPGDDPKFAAQGYLAAGPGGINAPAAWARGADGTGGNLVDVEQGWFLAHEDLPTGIRLLSGQNSAKSFGHGCAVLGEIVGVDNSRGIVGAAPGATAMTLSYFSTDPFDSAASRKRIHGAIMLAGIHLAPGRDAAGNFGDGGVLLVEAQIAATFNGTRRMAPIEVDRAIFEAISLLTTARVIVVEPAGNGNANLDDFRDAAGKQVLRRATADFRESGAIMVAGAMAATPHVKVDEHASQPPTRTNFGSRIDCYAWGERIVTTGFSASTATATNVYWESSTQFFGGTSGAAPVIASACLLVQGLQRRLTPRPGVGIAGALPPRRIRDMLTKAANGTASADPIGIMPDFAKLIPAEYL